MLRRIRIKAFSCDVIDARILRVENYGSFCDIGCGITALLPTNRISVTHINNPKEVLNKVRNIKVVVDNIKEDGKINLSQRELLGTWDEEASKFTTGETVCGTVLSVEDYGIFIRLSQNLSGLASPNTDVEVKPGDVVSVHIHLINEETMKIKLNIISRLDCHEEPMKFNYYIMEGHISHWSYMSKGYTAGKKCVETNYGGDTDGI